VRGLAKHIVRGDVLTDLLDVRLIALDMGAPVVGVMFLGEFEEHLKTSCLRRWRRDQREGHSLHRRYTPCPGNGQDAVFHERDQSVQADASEGTTPVQQRHHARGVPEVCGEGCSV
jgi:hypothetical protein